MLLLCFKNGHKGPWVQFLEPMIATQGFYKSKMLTNPTVNWLMTVNVSTCSTNAHVCWDFKGIYRRGKPLNLFFNFIADVG